MKAYANGRLLRKRKCCLHRNCGFWADVAGFDHKLRRKSEKKSARQAGKQEIQRQLDMDR